VVNAVRPKRERSLVVKLQPSKLLLWVRFPPLAYHQMLSFIVHFINICQFYIVIVQDSLKTLVVREFLFLDVNLSGAIKDKFQFYLASATK
jgi:hypothetical protein